VFGTGTTRGNGRPADRGRRAGALGLEPVLGTPAPEDVPEAEALRASWLGPRTVVVENGTVVLNEATLHRGLDMAETLSGTPPERAILRWGEGYEGRRETAPRSILGDGFLALG
jgi:hypothetical protein